jgi:hypothetical protein
MTVITRAKKRKVTRRLTRARLPDLRRIVLSHQRRTVIAYIENTSALHSLAERPRMPPGIASPTTFMARLALQL